MVHCALHSILVTKPQARKHKETSERNRNPVRLILARAWEARSSDHREHSKRDARVPDVLQALGIRPLRALRSRGQDRWSDSWNRGDLGRLEQQRLDEDLCVGERQAG